jgi:hypothetical protein
MAKILCFAPRNPIPGPLDDEIEVTQNKNWDLFLQAAKEAYQWRDPESLVDLANLVAALEPHLLRRLPNLEGSVQSPAVVLPFVRQRQAVPSLTNDEDRL